MCKPVRHFKTALLFPLVLPLLVIPLLAQARDIVFWHNQTGPQAEFIGKVVREFNAKHSARIRAETGLELESTLITQLDGKMAPDILLLPSDLLGLHKEFQLSEIPPAWKSQEIEEDAYEAGTVKGKLFGVPVLGGNHLLLYFNRKFVSNPAHTWSELRQQALELRKKGVHPIGWAYSEPYYFLPFLAAFGGSPVDGTRITLNTSEMKEALDAYRSLSEGGLVPSNCSFECSTTRFYQGKYAYAINGDWALMEARKKLGENLGTTALPSLYNRPINPFRAFQLLVFPKLSLSGPVSKIAPQFVRYLQSEEIQTRWLTEASRVPVRKTIGVKMKTSQEQLRFYRLVPNTAVTLYAWTAMKKGLQQLRPETKDTRAIAAYMQKLATQLESKGLKKGRP